MAMKSPITHLYAGTKMERATFPVAYKATYCGRPVAEVQKVTNTPGFATCKACIARLHGKPVGVRQ